MLEKINKVIEGIYQAVVSLVGVIVLSIILIMSIISTCYKTSDSNELTFFCHDNPIANVIFIIVFVVVGLLLRKLKIYSKFSTYIEDDRKFKQVKAIILFIIFAVSAFFVLSTQYIPGVDQGDVMNCAYKLHAKEYNMLESGGYLERWTNQAGLVVIQYFLARIWGDFNTVALQLLNVVGITLLYKKVADIMAGFNASRMTQVMTLISGICFYPLIMYTAFVYGTIWHVALALVAFNQTQKFFESYRWQKGLGAALAMALAIQVKNNALIYLIAIVIFGLYKIFTSKETIIKRLAFFLAMCLIVVFVGKLPGYYIEKTTGYKLGKGVSSYAFIAMGLQEGEFAPGWYNGYNLYTYIDNGSDTEVQTEIAKEEIANRLQVFASDLPYTFQFFTNKTASMWAEPTFQCFWIHQLRYHRVKLPTWIENLMSAKGYVAAANLIDYFQTIVYLGALLWLVLEAKDKFNKKSFFILAFLGGFTFHIFWEAKTQYSVSYMVLLLPVAVQGFGLLFAKLEAAIASKSIKEADIRIPRAVLTLVIIAAFCLGYKTMGQGCMTKDTPTFEAYVDAWVAPELDESVLEINILKANYESNLEYIQYLQNLLQENEIGY